MKFSRLLLAFALPTLLAGCVGQETDSSRDGTERGPLGKADAAGSCLGADDVPLCGGPSDGSCWCDVKCNDYGDCCEDKLDVCGGDQPDPDLPQLCLSDDSCEDGEVCDHTECLSSCAPGMVCPAVCFGECVEGTSGGEEGDACSLFGDQCNDGLVCEFVCPFEADPCPNFGINPSGFCAPEPPPPPPLVKCNDDDLPCDDGEYCHWDADESCGDDGGSGSCQPLPEACAEIFAPVCGCDGEVYGNACEANVAGLSWTPAAAGSDGWVCPNDPPPPPAEGSCENVCGTYAPGKVCYCDDQCTGLGDCCDDFADACGA